MCDTVFNPQCQESITPSDSKRHQLPLSNVGQSLVSGAEVRETSEGDRLKGEERAGEVRAQSQAGTLHILHFSYDLGQWLR